MPQLKAEVSISLLKGGLSSFLVYLLSLKSTGKSY